MARNAIITIERTIIAQDGLRHLIIDTTKMNYGLVDHEELSRMDNVLAVAVKITATAPSGQVIARYER